MNQTYVFQRKSLSIFDTDTQLRGHCQETAHCNAIRHLEDVWEIENLPEVWKSPDNDVKLFQMANSFLSLYFKVETV